MIATNIPPRGLEEVRAHYQLSPPFMCGLDARDSALIMVRSLSTVRSRGVHLPVDDLPVYWIYRHFRDKFF